MNKRGSALLIVLGVMAFITASVVSFAVYMRESRLPSSYFRRAMSERQFVKAALAYAIDEIDAAVGDDPYPGVGKNTQPLRDDGAAWGSDTWKSRVLMPFDMCEWSNTVTVLSFEGLGYLPPAIVNEVRWGARCTTNALWRSFNFDLGRYAFVAVNVSDFLDVNRLRASTNRTMSAPITLGCALAAENTTDVPEIDAKEFDFFLNRRGGNDPQVPFTSMMDYGLASWYAQANEVKHASPFGNMIRNWTSSSDSWYAGMTSNEVARQAFVTDSWFPKTNTTWRVDLNNPEDQPFAQCESWFPGEAPGKTSLYHCYYDIDTQKQPWSLQYFGLNDRNVFPIIAQALLCDYLDYDSVPLSLAMPCAEIAPMVVGVEAGGTFNFLLGVKKTAVEQQPAQDGEEPDEVNEYLHTLCVEANPDVIVHLAFPFRRVADRLRSKKFFARCEVRLFFAEDAGDASMGERGLRIPYSNADARRLCPPEPYSWPSSQGVPGDVEANPSCLYFKSQEETITVPDCDADEASAVITDVAFRFDSAPYRTLMSHNGDRGLLLAKYQYNETQKKYAWPLDADGNLTDEAYQNAFRLYRGDWSFAKLGDGSGSMKPSLAVWVRVYDQDGATVDLVPAHVHYDTINNHNEHNEADIPSVWRTCSNDRNERPLLRFYGNEMGLKFDRATLLELAAPAQGQIGATFVQGGYYCCDPRYNYAPEDWVAFDAQTVAEKDGDERWLDDVVHPTIDDMTVPRDRDIFMFVSNQGYLQSPYELTFIPRLKPFDTNKGDNEWGEFMLRSTFDGKVRTSVKDLADYDLMWRTYLPKTFGGEDDFESLRMHGCGSEEAFRVNPYGDSRFIAQAVANTPWDWFYAGTNAQNTCCSAERSEKRAQAANLGGAFQRAFCSKSADDASKWTFAETQALGQQLSGQFHAAADGSWLAAYDGFNWGDVPSVGGADPLDAFADNLTFADRKYLYAFWRNCFANRQQLFLVFMRAEMNTISLNDQSRRGIRSVALVWRDPAKPMVTSSNRRAVPGGANYSDMSRWYLEPNGGSGSRPDSWRTYDRYGPPHRTRVLFYHQFD